MTTGMRVWTLRVSAVLVVASTALLGCSSKVASGNGGAGGDGAGGAQQCDPPPPTNDYADVCVAVFNGVVSCTGGFEGGSTGVGPVEIVVEGVVRNAGSGTFVVDSCHPNDSCAPAESRVTLSGTDLSVSIPDGTFVQMYLYSYITPGVGFLFHVIVRNVPSWGSTPNPTSDGTFLWLAHHDAVNAVSLPDDPYQIKPELVCEQTSVQALFRFYALRFSFPDAPDAEVVAPQGQTVTWSVPEGEYGGDYRVRNVIARNAIAETWEEFYYHYGIARK